MSQRNILISFFIPPHYILTAADSNNWFSLAVVLLYKVLTVLLSLTE